MTKEGVGDGCRFDGATAALNRGRRSSTRCGNRAAKLLLHRDGHRALSSLLGSNGDCCRRGGGWWICRRYDSRAEC